MFSINEFDENPKPKPKKKKNTQNKQTKTHENMFHTHKKH